jgi:glycine dehydrogenase subunit 1
MTYISNTNTDRQAMLDAIGARSLEDLFRDIPEELKDRFRPLNLPARSELEARRILETLASLNTDAQETISFQGGGIYDHYIPSIVSHVTSRSEFYTAYTPYQPEVSQGTLTAMFEFQTLICELTEMEIANASMYDGASALAEAVLMAQRIGRTKRVAVARSLFPHYRRVLDTYCWAADIDIVEVPYTESGRCDVTAVPKEISAFVLQTPNVFGVIESLDGLKEMLADALLIVAVNPISLGLLEPPGEFGADIVVGEGQPLGIPAAFGGPLLGLLATRKEYLRQTPGRIAGQTVDTEGHIGYTMAAQTREQHIRRERATSNICTNSALCALAATVYLASLGASGLRKLAELNLEKAHYLAEQLVTLPGYALVFQAPFFNEFTVRTPEDPRAIRQKLKENGILVEDPQSLVALGLPDALRFAVTEKRTKEELDRVVAILRDAG